MQRNVAVALAAIRKRRLYGMLAPLCALTMLAFFGMASTYWRVGHLIPFALVVPLCFLGTAYMLLRWSFAKCPRCGEFLFIRRIDVLLIYGNVFARRCLNCRLPLSAKVVCTAEEIDRLETWVAATHPKPSIPDVGLACPTCGYLLAGICREQCPECGEAFDLVEMVSSAKAALG